MRFDAAISLSGAGAIADQRGELEEAARLFDRSLAIRRSVADADPKDVQAQERLGYALFRSGKIQTVLRRPDVGRVNLTEAVRLLTRLFEVTGDQSTQSILGEALIALAETETSLRHRAAACDAFRLADRTYRDLPLNTENDKGNQATARRETAACR